MKHSSILLAAGALAVATGPALADLGARGSLAIEGDIDLDVTRRTTEQPDGDKESETRFVVGGNVHYFVADHVSVNVSAGYGRISDDDGAQSTVAASVGAGYQVALGGRLHLWPRVGALYRYTSGPVLSRDASLQQVTLAAWAPLIIELAPHFYLGAGPVFTQDVSATLTIDGDERDGSKDMNLGVSTVLGGYLGD